jgi:Cobalamin-independent synthase, Catalytic domain
MPGTDVREAMTIISGELPDFPHLPELPDRGAGADMVGRTMALIARVSGDFGVETIPTGWRLSGGVTRDLRRSWSWLGEDLDAAEEVVAGTGVPFKVQVCGPWTLAATVEAPTGGAALKDRGLVSELAEALLHAAADHVAEARRRLPNADVVLQVDEPALPAVLAGRIATASGFGRLPGVGATEAAQTLSPLTEVCPVVLHCCDQFPFEVAAGAGVAGYSWDLERSGEPEQIGAAFESGARLVVGAVPTTWESSVEEAWGRLLKSWRDSGLAEGSLREVAFSPACGLAGASPAHARARLAQVAQIVRRCTDLDR